MSTKFRPLGDRICVTVDNLESKSPGGIVIPDTVDKEKSMEGRVVSIGEGKKHEGKHYPLQVKVGDKVLFGKYAGTTIKLDNIEYLVMREEDVMGVIEE